MHRNECLANIRTAVLALFKYVRSGELNALLSNDPRDGAPSDLPQHRLSRGDVIQLVADYKSGTGSIYTLATKYGAHRQTIAAHLRANGLTLGRAPLSDIEQERARRLRDEGWSANRIGLAMGRDPKTIMTMISAL